MGNGKQNFREDKEKVLDPVTKSVKNVTEDVTKTMSESSKVNS